MIRPFLALTAGILCALAGCRQSVALKSECTRLRRWTELLRHLTLIISQATHSLPDALFTVSTGQQLPDRLLRQLAQDMQHKPLEGLATLFQNLSVPSTEKELLLRLMHRFGYGSLEQRTLALRQAEEELQLLLEQSAEREKRDSKLFRTLGLTCGACLTILLL